MATIDTQYEVKVGSLDFSDIIAMENGYQWTIISESAESATGQDTTGLFHIPVLGERVQLIFTAPEYVRVSRLKQFAQALKMGSKGQREVAVTYHDPLFGTITHNFYCTNIPMIKERLPDPPHEYASGVKIQLASTSFMKRQVLNDTPKKPIKTNPIAAYEFKLNGKEFNDVIAIDGFSTQYIEQSLESQTGQTLDGVFHIPIIGGRSQNAIKAIEYLEVGRFRQLGKELGFGKVGERSTSVTYDDVVHGRTTQPFYCTTITGYVQKLPDYPYHYIKDVTFQLAMKQFF